MEEEITIVDSEANTKPLIVVQVGTTKIIIEQLEA